MKRIRRLPLGVGGGVGQPRSRTTHFLRTAAVAGPGAFRPPAETRGLLRTKSLGAKRKRSPTVSTLLGLRRGRPGGGPRALEFPDGPRQPRASTGQGDRTRRAAILAWNGYGPSRRLRSSRSRARASSSRGSMIRRSFKWVISRTNASIC